MKRFATGMAFAALLVPQLSLAATPQQLLDRAMEQSMAMRAPQVNTMDFTFNFTSRPVARGEQPSGVKVHIVARAETLPRTDVSVDSEQSFRIVSLDLVGASDLPPGMPMHWQDPASFELKKIGNVYYVRLASLSTELRALIAQLPVSGLNLDQIVGHWLQIDLDHLGQALQDMLPGSTSVKLTAQSQNDLTRQLLPILEAPGVLRALRIESRSNVDGVKRVRIPFQISPRFWSQLETVLRQQIVKDLADLKATNRKAYNTQYAQQVKELHTTLTTLRTKLAPIHMVAVMRETSGQIDRIEAAGKMTQPAYTEEYVRGRFVKRLSAHEDISFTLVSTLQGEADRQIAVPESFITVESLMQLAKQKFEAMNASTDDSNSSSMMMP